MKNKSLFYELDHWLELYPNAEIIEFNSIIKEVEDEKNNQSGIIEV